MTACAASSRTVAGQFVECYQFAVGAATGSLLNVANVEFVSSACAADEFYFVFRKCFLRDPAIKEEDLFALPRLQQDQTLS